MSSAPWPEGVARIRALLLDCNTACEKMDDNNARIAALEKENATWQADLRKWGKEATDLVGRMDVTSTGNYGWENRFLWFARHLLKEGEEK